MPRERAPRLKSTIDAAASRLRALARAANADALLGSEEALVAQLGVSRATLRQVARLLEREGLLKVRRGINGGYFAARPDLRTVEHYDQHLTLPRGFCYRPGEGVALGSIGLAHAALGELQRAIEGVERAREFVNEAARAALEQHK